MIQRCVDPKATNYDQYGGRGISVCERWKQFECFLEDMGERPEGTTLDRKDTNEGYHPGNCRWSTRKVQSRNRRNNKLFDYKGELRCVSEWAEVLGIEYELLSGRLKLGWDFAKAAETPVLGTREVDPVSGRFLPYRNDQP